MPPLNQLTFPLSDIRSSNVSGCDNSSVKEKQSSVQSREGGSSSKQGAVAREAHEFVGSIPAPATTFDQNSDTVRAGDIVNVMFRDRIGLRGGPYQVKQIFENGDVQIMDRVEGHLRIPRGNFKLKERL